MPNIPVSMRMPMLPRLLKLAAMLGLTVLIASCSPKTIQLRPHVNDFWKNVGWKRYTPLAKLVVPDRHKELRKWLGPKKELEFRILESTIEELEYASEETAEITMFVRFFNEREYVEKTTEVTQTWIRVNQSWLLKKGFPLDEKLQEKPVDKEPFIPKAPQK